MTLLCVSLMPKTTDEARQGLAEAARTASLAELRLDALREFDLARILSDKPCPVVVTYRPKREGGLYDGPEAARLQALREAARLGADYLDVEHDAFAALGPVGGAKTIVSYHNFRETPGDLPAIHARLAALGATVVKVAALANHILDTVAVLRILRDARVPTIALSMGPKGVLTRLLAPKFGAFLTYAAAGTPGKGSGALSRKAPDPLPPAHEAGPGQVSVGEMLDLYRVGRIGPSTRVYGVIADPVGHSLSPRIHNTAFAALGLDAVYLPLWVEGDPAAFVAAMREFAFDGYSVTIPHKQTVMRACDQVEPLARRIGAINTIQRRPDGTLFATNTDWTAGMAAIEAVVGPGWLRGKRALIIGAGGVGRAMAFGLKERGAAVTLADVDEARAAALAAEVGVERCRLGDIAGVPCETLLNCTPIGMHPRVDATAVPREMLREGMLVYDAVYNPLQTRLIREARAAGCRTVPGIDHFVRQAVEQFELWTGRPAPVEKMREVVVAALS